MADGNPIKMNPAQKHRFWQAHVERWKQSGMGRAAVCRQNNLKPRRWTYWEKISPEPAAVSRLYHCSLPPCSLWMPQKRNRCA
jgi:hypothetical protein